jgi:hypothetical protein
MVVSLLEFCLNKKNQTAVNYVQGVQHDQWVKDAHDKEQTRAVPSKEGCYIGSQVVNSVSHDKDKMINLLAMISKKVLRKVLTIVVRY